MKKSILLILASLFAIFALAGCADDSSSNNNASTTPPSTSPTVVPIDLTNNPESLTDLVGNYEITFFYTNGANVLPISSDCDQVAYYLGAADTKCVKGNNDVQMKGYGTVALNQEKTHIQITTKMQMTNQYLKNPSSAPTSTRVLWNQAQNNQYNYTVFEPIPIDAIADGAVNSGASAVSGVTGRNLVKNTTDNKATYKFELLSDGSIRNTMVDNSIMSANVTVIMKKIDALPTGTMDKNTPFLEPAITGFVTNPADISNPETLNGTYNVTFFGTQVTKVQGDEPLITSMAEKYYISNNCTKAQQLYPDIVNQGTKNECKTPVTMLDGSVVMTVANGNLNITSRMQMEGTVLNFSPSDKYQYTTYTPTTDLTTFKGTGVTGYNYDTTNNAPSAESTSYPDSSYQITQLDDGSLRIDMTLVGKTVGLSTKVDAVNTIILEKVSDDTTALENKIQYPFSTTTAQ
ncbi:MAG: hypothetical protein MSA07_01275 [Mucispirillum sp.]|nr:hypothetical protein [Mucispirillum sp.]